MKNNHQIHNLEANYTAHGEGAPVILLHGVAGSLHQWDYLIPALTGAGYRALAVDLLGHGDSPWIQNSHNFNGSGYHIESIYQHFAAWLASLNLSEPPFIISHSMGGYLALTHTLRGHVVRGLLLASPYYTPRQLTGPVRLSVRRPEVSMMLLQNTPTWWVESAIMISDRNGFSLPNAARRQMAEDFKRFDPRMIALPQSTEDLTPHLPHVRVPTMIIWGDNDLTLSPGTFPRLAISVPHSKSLRIPNCGHVPHLTHRDLFNQTVLDFLGEVMPI